jgi:hypothetical protein
MWLGAAIWNVIKGIWNAFLWVVNLIIACVGWLAATVLNILIGAANGIIQFLWTYFVERFIGVIEWILNAANGGFTSFGGAVANLIGQIISWFLSLGKVVTKIIDAIFGTNWTAGLESLQDKVLAWGKKDDGSAITLSREAPTIDRFDATDAWTNGMNTFEYAGMTNLDEAYLQGAIWANKVKYKIDSWGGKLTNDDKNKNKTTKNVLLSEYDPALALNTDDFAADVAGIEENTDDMKDAMDLADDDLEFLRRIAEMEWHNEFTTAEIKVEMNNTNTVTGERDLDGIVSYLGDKLRAEMTNVAHGVHA